MDASEADEMVTRARVEQARGETARSRDRLRSPLAAPGGAVARGGAGGCGGRCAMIGSETGAYESRCIAPVTLPVWLAEDLLAVHSIECQDTGRGCYIEAAHDALRALVDAARGVIR